MRGHVRKRGARWAFVVEEGRDLVTGKRRQRWHSGFRTRREAERALAEALGSLDRGTYVRPSRATVADYLSEWLEGRRASLRPSTWASYRMNVTKHLAPRIGGLPLQDLTASRLDRMYAELLATGRRKGEGGLSPRTVRYIHTILRKALADAVRKGLVTRNVADLADPPAFKATRARAMKTWSAAELRAFLGHVAEDRLYAVFLLAATTGMRRGEVVGLRWRELDLEAARLAVSHTLVSVDYAVGESSPKTDGGRRSVALDPGTVAALRAHRSRQAEERLARGPAWTATGLVFTREDGSALHPEALSAAFTREAKAAGLPRIRFHDLRHTHATLALQAGVHPKVVSERLGHASVAITLDTYSHAIPAMQADAAAAVAALVLG